ncbi:MAG TPA: hypothetical protein DD637_05530 [Verrucomicrobia bacterium]|nr:hypothetical protein [Verrucomicrobiota bacterium]HCG19578.1 hypothetical protein [Verrucomicrobiota bacterium]
MLRFALFVLFGSVFAGCASIQPYYTPNPDIAANEVEDYEGPLDAELVAGTNIAQRIARREAADYAFIGSAAFTGAADEDWTSAMVRLGRTLKTEKIDYFTWYAGTDTATGMTSVPVMRTSFGTVWGPDGPRTVPVTMLDTDWLPYSYTVPRYEYRVLYYKKRKEPLPMGIRYEWPGEELGRRIGTRKALEITLVVPGRTGWKNDLFDGDVILAVNGRTPTKELMRQFCRAPAGGKLKIWRDGQIVEKTISADPSEGK